MERQEIPSMETVLRQAYEKGREAIPAGRVATYIPELSKADRYAFGIVMKKNDGTTYSCGDVHTRFTIQSIGKVISLAAALTLFGSEEVFRHVLMEPTGDSFNSIIKLDTASNLPYNPMINAGAIQVVSLLAQEFSFEDMLEFARQMCMDEEITLNKAVFYSEQRTGDRNRAIAYLLRSKGVLCCEPDRALDFYFRLCSMNVTAESLANLGLLLANDGRNPLNGTWSVHPDYVRTINSLMFTCGMYDLSGEFGVKVGVPAKSGVGGGIVCGVKNRMGIGIYGPAVDSKGNSVAGVAALEQLSAQLHLHMFDYRQPLV